MWSHQELPWSIMGTKIKISFTYSYLYFDHFEVYINPQLRLDLIEERIYEHSVLRLVLRVTKTIDWIVGYLQT